MILAQKVEQCLNKYKLDFVIKTSFFSS